MNIILGMLKKIFWKLPLGNKFKESFARKCLEKKIMREEKEDEKIKQLKILTDENLLKSYALQILEQPVAKSKEFEMFKEYAEHDFEINLVAYYLTQFHPNQKNNLWWGKGTTEWNNVNRAVPQFVDHYQPRRPGELGYYDLRIMETMERQIKLAKNYGIKAFCFYYYWFDGERLLEQPLNMFLKEKSLEISFFYCWANENWTKRFTGTDTGVLMSITHTEENYTAFIESIIDDLMDKRYYCILNKPVLSIYRPSLIPNPKVVLQKWREIFRNRTGKELYLIAVQEINIGKCWINEGFDAETQFQPKQIEHYCNNITKNVKPLRNDFSGKIYDYEELVTGQKYKKILVPERKVYQAVMPMWDNTARRNHRGTIFHGSTPELYKKWLFDAIVDTKHRELLDDKMVLINAWNEWGEGAYLEPDAYFGYAYLQATREALEMLEGN